MTKGGRSRQNRRLWWDLAIVIVCAWWVLDMVKVGVEGDRRICNELTEKPGFAGILTCQKLYHYQPDPFTG
jgi:hypothetical protein